MREMRLRRSLGFWLGLLPVVFLLWVWVDSRAYLNTWGRSRAPLNMRYDRVAISGSAIRMTRSEFLYDPIGKGWSAFPTTGSWGVFYRRPVWTEPDLPNPWLPAPSYLQKTENFPREQLEVRELVVPLWLLLAVYLVGWIGMLAWLRWRVRRLSVVGDALSCSSTEPSA